MRLFGLGGALDQDAVLVRLTQQELVILANAINEAREALEDWEFPIRMGGDVAEALELQTRLGALLDSLGAAPRSD